MCKKTREIFGGKLVKRVAPLKARQVVECSEDAVEADDSDDADDLDLHDWVLECTGLEWEEQKAKSRRTRHTDTGGG